MGHEGVKVEKGNSFTGHAELNGEIKGDQELWADLEPFHQRQEGARIRGTSS